MGDAVLIFPPLVEGSFGQYFPSIAVLAGYLAKQDVPVRQIDLNEQFAEFLLSPAYLRQSQEGRLVGYPDPDPRDISVTAARWLAKNRDALFTADGRHDFGSETGSSFLLQALAKPYVIDPDISWLANELSIAGARELEIFGRFFDEIDLARQIEPETRFIGISVPMGPQLVPALLLAQLLRELRPDARIVLGGPTLSLMDPHDLSIMLKRHRAVDAVVRFDGEYPLGALVAQACRDQWAPDQVAGVSSVSVDGTVTHVPPSVGPSLNTLPWPAYQLDLLEQLAAPSWSITQARGCYWGKCDYCDFVEMYDGSPPYRGRSVGSFIAEMEHAVSAHHILRFEIITESIPPAFARRLSKEILTRNLDVQWNSFAMVDRRFDADLFSLMRSAGCEYLVIGMETMNTRLLKLVHKSADREENIRFLREAREAGIRLRVNLIPDLPSATYAEAMAALTDVISLQDCVEGFAIFPFEATRSSKVGRDPGQFGLQVVTAPAQPERSYQAQYDINHLGNIDPAMSDEERRAVHQAYMDFSVQHSERAFSQHLPFLSNVPADGGYMRFASRWIDVYDDGTELSIVNILTRKRMKIPSRVREVVNTLIKMERFTVRELGADTEKGLAGRLVDEMIRCRLLEAVPEQ
jgi:Radical SAM superfamily